MVSGKACREQKTPHPDLFMQLFDNLETIIDFGSHFGAHWIWDGGPQIDIFWKASKTNEKNELQEAGWKKHDVVTDF